jgi:hypothetical protein
MHAPTRYLLADLEAAINVGNTEATFYACQELARYLGELAGEAQGLEAAVAVAQALAFDAAHVVTAPPRLVVQFAPGLARCA